jgi:hypothetical protein
MNTVRVVRIFAYHFLLILLVSLLAGCKITQAVQRPFAGVSLEKPDLLKAIGVGDLQTVKRLVTTDNVNQGLKWTTVVEGPDRLEINWEYWAIFWDDTKTDICETPLLAAVRTKQRDIVEYLLFLGADVNTGGNYSKVNYWYCRAKRDNHTIGPKTYKSSGSRPSPLHMAAAWDQGLTEEFLEKGARINAEDSDLRTPLYWAIQNEKGKVTELLIAKGADVNARDKDSWTPLHYAAINSKINVMKLLITKGARIEAKNKDGKTPLDLLKAKNFTASEIKELEELSKADERAAEQEKERLRQAAAAQERERKAKQWEIVRAEVDAALKVKDMKKAVSLLRRASEEGLGEQEPPKLLSQIYASSEWQASLPKVGIVKFEVFGDVPPAAGKVLYTTLINRVVESRQVVVVDWEEIDRVLQYIAKSQPNVSDTDARQQAINQLGIQKIYVGSVAKIGRKYHVSVKILRLDLSVEKVEEDSVDSEDGLAELINKISARLILTGL